jgi:hypothetical protein
MTILLGPRGRWTVIPVVALLALWAGLRLAWQQWGNKAASGEDYVVRAADLFITPQPAWIHSDVKAEVVRAGGLDGLSLRDPNLVEQVQRAFSLSGWVARVVKVQKRYPARIDVALEYRRPVAMVEVTWRGQPSLYFVDEQSVLLPKEDEGKTPQERQREYQDYVRIQAGDVSAAGRIAGQPWGRNKIAGAARLAALGRERWQEMGVYRIVVSDDLNAQPLYELETKSALRVLWGHAPGAEGSDEPDADAKWKWLLQFVAKNGPLDKSAAERRIDLRSAPVAEAPSTATLPGAGEENRR